MPMFAKIELHDPDEHGVFNRLRSANSAKNSGEENFKLDTNGFGKGRRTS